MVVHVALFKVVHDGVLVDFGKEDHIIHSRSFDIVRLPVINLPQREKKMTIMKINQDWHDEVSKHYSTKQGDARYDSSLFWEQLGKLTTVAAEPVRLLQSFLL